MSPFQISKFEWVKIIENSKLSWGPLVSRSHRLTGHTGRLPAQHHGWWPCAIGGHRPRAPPQVTLIRRCSLSMKRSHFSPLRSLCHRSTLQAAPSMRPTSSLPLLMSRAAAPRAPGPATQRVPPLPQAWAVSDVSTKQWRWGEYPKPPPCPWVHHRRPAPLATGSPHWSHREHHLCFELLFEPRACRHDHWTTPSTPFASGRPPAAMEHIPRWVSPLSTTQNWIPEPPACISAIFPTPSHRRSPESASAAIARAPWPPLPYFQFGPASFGP
jgi:hypothetical protein